MFSIMHRGARSLTRRAWDILNPRAVAWRYIEKRRPNEPIITKLGRYLKVRIYKNDVIGKYIYVDGMFEKTEAVFVTKFLKPGMVFFDVGANLGQYTLLAAHQIGGKNAVHSFEPSTRMFSELEFNVNLNGLSDICVLNKVALSDSVGTADLSRYKQGEEVYGSLGKHRRGEIIGYETVKTTTLDAYIEHNHISHIDLLKIDIEGAEFPALRGANKALSNNIIKAIVLEMADINTIGFGYRATEIWDYLEALGYRFRRFDRKGRVFDMVVRPSDFSIAQNLLAVKNA